MFYFRDKILPVFLEARAALQTIKGVGKWKSKIICTRIGMMFPFFLENFDAYPYFLSWFFLFSIRFFVLPTDTVLRKLKRRMKALLSLKIYRASRHMDFLPVRGQRTRSNAGTLRILREKQK